MKTTPECVDQFDPLGEYPELPMKPNLIEAVVDFVEGYRQGQKEYLKAVMRTVGRDKEETDKITEEAELKFRETRHKLDIVLHRAAFTYVHSQEDKHLGKKTDKVKVKQETKIEGIIDFILEVLFIREIK